MFVRREGAEDVDAVREIVVAAFDAGNGAEPVEARLLDELRTCSGWIPEMSLVAVDERGIVVGHVVGTRGFVGDESCVGLGPLAVTPELQRTGIGHALMHTMLGALDALGEPLAALLGSPDYYARFGFVPATAVSIDAPDPEWGQYFQVRSLESYRPEIRGTFAYAEPFTRL